MAIPSHLIIKTDGLQFESLFADWQWMLIETYTPILMNAFGDVFLRDKTGRVHFLDLMCGEFKQVAASEEEFNQLCENREQRRSWFIGHLVMELRKFYGDLVSGQCFGCKIPLSLGGGLVVSNFRPEDILVHFSVLGQLHRQTRHLPPGTKIHDVTLEEPR